MSKIIIAGGTGMVGVRLSKWLLEAGHEVVILSRNCSLEKNKELLSLQKIYNDALQCAVWDTKEMTMDAYHLSTADAIVNLAGAGVADERWTDERKEVIISSRVDANKTIIESLRNNPNKIKTIVNASAIGWYGDDSDRPLLKPFTEDTPPADDFLAKTCVLWESSIDPVMDLGKRLVKVRIGIVLAPDGGAYPQFRKTLMLRVATVMGHGRQIVSWIHIDDLCRIIIQAIDKDDMQGVYNAVAPYSVTNEKLVRTIAQAIHRERYAKFKVPKTILKIALGEMSTEVLKSSLVSARKILDTGYEYLYPKINDAVQEIESSDN